MTRPRATSRNRGMATVTAMALVALMASAMLAMVQTLRFEAETVRTASTEAQLRQLLQIGARASKPLVPREGGRTARTWNVALPPELEDRGGVLSLRAEPGRTRFERFVRIDAQLDRHSARQTLRYITADERSWTLVEADLSE